MKNNKYPKIIIGILMIFTAFILAACTSDQRDFTLNLSTYEVTLEVGQTLHITHELKNGDKVLSDMVTWESTNEGVATVLSGVVNTLSEGTTTIKATYKSLSKSVLITVVKQPMNTYTIIFNTDGGTLIEPVEVQKDNTVSKPTNPTKPGHVFDTWYKDEALTKSYDFNDPVTSNMTLYANWIAQQVTVTFVTNDALTKDSIVLDYGTKVLSSDLIIDKESHIIENWYLDQALTTVFDLDTPITSDITLYAKWEVRVLTITFVANDPLITKANIQMNYNAILSAGQLNITAKAHHDFAGWFMDEDFNQAFVRTNPIKADVMLYAKWIEHAKTSYTINHFIKTSATTTELHTTTTVEDVYVGTKVTVSAMAIPNLVPDQQSVEVTVLANNQTVINMYYGPQGFTYELEFNDGNTKYTTRTEMVTDWIKDYNTFGGTSYTLETLPMGIWQASNIHNFMYSPAFRSKWLWMAQYLRVVGSSTNKGPVGLLVTLPTLAQFEVNNDNKFAVSYEVRGFIKGMKFSDNASWQSSDYSIVELQTGFWPYLAAVEQKVFSDGQFEKVLPTNVYLPNHDFEGWYVTPDFSGEKVTVITGTTKVYAKYKEKTPVEGLIITNLVEEMEKGVDLQLNVTILPLDAYNKTLIYTSSDVRTAIISPDGLITALNEGTVTITVKSQNGLVIETFELHIYPKDDIKLEFSEGFNGFIQVNDQFTLEAIGVGRQATSENYSYHVVDQTVLHMSEPGVFNALKVGETEIVVMNLDTPVFTYTVVVQEVLTESRIDQLLALLVGGHNPVATGVNVVPYYTANEEWSDPRHESVNAYLFDNLVVDRTNYRLANGMKDSGARPSTDFILIHDTANLNGGLVAHGNFFLNPTSNSVSIHYITGDYGAIQSLSEDRVGWHGGSGQLQFEWFKTGVMATSDEAPYIDISVDGYFTFNGTKSLIQAPRGTNNQILDRSYLTYLGPSWEIRNNEYYMGSTYFTTSQQSRGVIATKGGNTNSIGIEMAVNKDGDIMDTVQRTAKLVAELLEKYDLDNRRVIMHNSTDGKGDPYTLNNTVYKGSWYFDRFMEFVDIEREVLKHFSDAKITLTSDSPLVSDTGRILELPAQTTEVTYTITVEIDGISKSITLTTIVPGIQTWSQNFGFFKPLQAYSKSDYRK